MDSVAAILLAAGSSRRMGKKNKLLLPYQGRSMIEHQVEEIQQSSLTNFRVVLGHDAEKIGAILPSQINTVFNANHLTGMTSSIQAGIEAVQENVKGYMICLSDMPWVTAKDYDEILHFFLKNIDKYPRLIVQPVYQQRRGHPVIFSSYYKKELLDHTAPEGCREVIRMNKKEVRHLDMKAPNVLKDIDTPGDYQATSIND